MTFVENSIKNTKETGQLVNNAKTVMVQGQPTRNTAILSNMLGKGIGIDQANAMLAQDIKKNEVEVKKTLSAAGVDGVPQNVYNGLVSFQNQVGNINYAYVNKEKIDLRELYKKKDWDRVASFIAADERDRSRRIAEAAMISNSSYGKIRSEEAIVQQGVIKTNELVSKGKLNQQTSTPASSQQLIGVATNYYNQTGKLLPGQNFSFNNMVTNNADKNIISDSIKKNLGKEWPY